MATLARDKYQLKTLHEEIDLFDRKLAHLLKYDTFATETAREASAAKLRAKRELLARVARELASEGVEFKPSDLPRSFRSADTVLEAEAAPEPAAAEVAPIAPVAQPTKPSPSPFAGTVLDGQAEMQAYKRARLKRAAVAETVA